VPPRIVSSPQIAGWDEISRNRRAAFPPPEARVGQPPRLWQALTLPVGPTFLKRTPEVSLKGGLEFLGPPSSVSRFRKILTPGRVGTIQTGRRKPNTSQSLGQTELKKNTRFLMDAPTSRGDDWIHPTRIADPGPLRFHVSSAFPLSFSPRSGTIFSRSRCVRRHLILYNCAGVVPNSAHTCATGRSSMA